jgi:nucleoside-diphosphate-sugar epimerase
MNILVVGGAGYVGSVLVPELDKLGYEVDVVDLLWFGNNLPSNINVIQKNAFDLTQEDIKQYQQIIFLAGLSNDPMAEFSPKQNFIQNCSLPSYLVYISKQAQVKRFIFASSCSIYGCASDKIYSESDNVFSSYPYGIAKIQAEFVIKNLSDKNFSTICLRKGTISGYSPRMRFDLVINAMFKSAILYNKIIVNNSDIWRPILSMTDAINAYIKSIEAPYNVSGVFNVASENYKILYLAQIIRTVLEKQFNFKNIQIDTKNTQDFRNYLVNCDYGKHTLNLKYLNKAEDIVIDLFNNRESFGDFSNINYYNIDAYKNIILNKEL